VLGRWATGSVIGSQRLCQPRRRYRQDSASGWPRYSAAPPLQDQRATKARLASTQNDHSPGSFRRHSIWIDSGPESKYGCPGRHPGGRPLRVGMTLIVISAAITARR
jgi:hypothetical protein